MRLFIAIELPQGIRSRIAEVQAGLQQSGADAGWTRPEGIHLTLKFLGEVPEDRLPEITRSLAEAVRGAESLHLEVAGAGAFPNAKNPRVLWLGVAGDLERLSALQAAVEQAMVGLGFEREDRAFSPHLTLARIKYLRPRYSWQHAIEGIKDVRLGAFDADHVSLMKSELHPKGAVYTEIARAELGKR